MFKRFCVICFINHIYWTLFFFWVKCSCPQRFHTGYEPPLGLCMTVGICLCVPAVHVQVHPLSLLKPAEVSSYLGLFHGFTLQVAQSLHKFNALVVSTAHKRLFSHLQIQLLQRCFCQQTPGRACTVRTDWIFRKYRQIPKDWNFPQKTSNPVTEITRHMVYDALPLIQLFVWCISICISFDLNKEQTASKICT